MTQPSGSIFSNRKELRTVPEDQKKPGTALKRLACIPLLLVLAVVLLTAGCTQTGSVTVSSEPSGAQVFVNGVANGTTPALLAGWPADDYSVEVRKAGSINTFGTVSVTAGDNGTATIRMAPIPVPEKKTFAQITDLNRRTTENIAYLGDFRAGTSGSRLTRIQLVIGKTFGETDEPFRLDGAEMVISTPHEIQQLRPDTPLYSEGKDPAPGTWRITGKINSEPDNNIDQNEQFTIVAVPGPGQAITMDGTAGIELRPRIGAAVSAKIA